MFERFTERARHVVVIAQEQARARGHTTLGTLHILVGLIREEEGVAARVLEKLGVTEQRVVDAMDYDVSEEDVPRAPMTPNAKKALELALREALSLGHNYIGTEHILLGLVRAPVAESRAALFLQEYAIRDAVIEQLSGPPSRIASMAPVRDARPRSETKARLEALSARTALLNALTDHVAARTAQVTTGGPEEDERVGIARGALLEVRQRLSAFDRRVADEVIDGLIREVIDPAREALK